MSDDTPLHERDEWIPPECKVARLLQMPMLASMAAEIGQSRNPDGTTSDHQPPTFGSWPAARLDIIDVAEGFTVPAELQTLILWCSRPIWESVDPETKAAHPQPIGTVTWATECTWLADVWGDSRAWLDEVDMGMVDMTLDDVYRCLTKAVGLRPPSQIPCPHEGCHSHLEPDGDMLVCHATRWQTFKHEYPGAARLAADWRQHPAVTTSEAVELIPGLTADRLRQWKRRHKIRPVHTEESNSNDPEAGQRHWWRPWDIILLIFPGIDTGEKGKGMVA